MVDGNAGLFILLQFCSRFANSFLTSAARYEILELGGAAKFAGAQILSTLSRTFASQAAGIITDSYPLKVLYVGVEAANVVLGIMLMLPGIGHTGAMLMAVNTCLGLAFAFSQPVTKSMPPMVASKDDLKIVNSWDMTCDKIGRYLAPIVYAVVSSKAGFTTAVFCSTIFYGILTLCRMRVKVSQEQDTKKNDDARKKKDGVFKQIWNGLRSLNSDRVLCLLILNTLLTNLLIYPLQSVAFPVLFKGLPENAAQTSLAGDMLAIIMRAFGIRKAKAWMNYNALVGLGGVFGPLLAGGVTYIFPKAGVIVGMVGQLIVTALLACVVYMSQSLDAGMLVFVFFILWVLMVTVNQIVTADFNSLSQQRLAREERGRYVANIITIFTMGNAMGTGLFGWVLSLEFGAVGGSAACLCVGIALKCLILVNLQRYDLSQEWVDKYKKGG